MVQGLLILVMAIAALLTGLFAGSFNTGWVRAYSGLAGGLTCLLPGLYSWFRLWVGRGVVRPVNTSLQHAPSGQDVSVQDGTEVARRALVQMLTAEAGKWALTILVMLMTFRFVPVSYTHLTLPTKA